VAGLSTHGGYCDRRSTIAFEYGCKLAPQIRKVRLPISGIGGIGQLARRGGVHRVGLDERAGFARRSRPSIISSTNAENRNCMIRRVNLHARRAQRDELRRVSPIADAANAGIGKPDFRICGASFAPYSAFNWFDRRVRNNSMCGSIPATTARAPDSRG